MARKTQEQIIEEQKLKQQKRQTELLGKILKENLANFETVRPVKSINPNLYVTGKRADQASFLTASSAFFSKKTFELFKTEMKKNLDNAKKEKSKEKKKKNEKKLEEKKTDSVNKDNLKKLEDIKSEISLLSEITTVGIDEEKKSKISLLKQKNIELKKQQKYEEELLKKEKAKEVFDNTLYGQALKIKKEFSEQGGVSNFLLKKVTNELGTLGDMINTSFDTSQKRKVEYQEELRREREKIERRRRESTLELIETVEELKSNDDITPFQRRFLDTVTDENGNLKRLNEEQRLYVLNLMDDYNKKNEEYFETFGETFEVSLKQNSEEIMKAENDIRKKYSKEKAEEIINSEEFQSKQFYKNREKLNELQNLLERQLESIEDDNIIKERNAKEEQKRLKKIQDDKERLESNISDQRSEERIQKEKEEQSLSLFRKSSLKVQESIYKKLESVNEGISKIKIPKLAEEGGILSSIIGGALSMFGGPILSKVGSLFSGVLGKFGKVGGLLAGAVGGITKMVSGGAGKTVLKEGTKIGIKSVGKTVGKSMLKKIPGFGLLAGAGFAAQRAMNGDWLGAGGELLSGLVSMVPVLGTAASVAIDAGLAARDASSSGKQTQSPKNEKLSKITKIAKLASVVGGGAMLAGSFMGNSGGAITNTVSKSSPNVLSGDFNTNNILGLEKTQLKVLDELVKINKTLSGKSEKEKIKRVKQRTKNNTINSKFLDEFKIQTNKEKESGGIFNTISNTIGNAYDIAKNWLFGDDKSSTVISSIDGSNIKSATKGDKALLDRIAIGEGTMTQGRSGYDVSIGFGKFNPKNSKPLTKMTLREVKKFQKELIKNGAPSSAVGKYQIISKTLNQIQKEMGLDDSTIFSPDIQDKMILHRLNKSRGYSKWKNGEISNRQFQENLSKEFASISSPSKGGASYYGQRVGTTTSQIQQAMGMSKPASGFTPIGSNGPVNPLRSTVSAGIDTGTTGGNVASAAKSAVGKIGYRWGGKGNDSFLDCSGFVQKVVRETGLAPDFPGNTKSQWAWLKRGVNEGKVREIKSYAELNGGDIIHFGGHIGIMGSSSTLVHSSGGSRCQGGTERNKKICKGVVEVDSNRYFKHKRPKGMFRITGSAKNVNINADTSSLQSNISASIIGQSQGVETTPGSVGKIGVGGVNASVNSNLIAPSSVSSKSIGVNGKKGIFGNNPVSGAISSNGVKLPSSVNKIVSGGFNSLLGNFGGVISNFTKGTINGGDISNLMNGNYQSMNVLNKINQGKTNINNMLAQLPMNMENTLSSTFKPVLENVPTEYYNQNDTLRNDPMLSMISSVLLTKM